MKERVAHPTQKPLALCDKLIRSCKQTDGYVLVPFAGSGSECVAAKNNNLPFIGIELNPEYITIITPTKEKNETSFLMVMYKHLFLLRLRLVSI
jgi:DNA modification methylase